MNMVESSPLNLFINFKKHLKHLSSVKSCSRRSTGWQENLPDGILPSLPVTTAELWCLAIYPVLSISFESIVRYCLWGKPSHYQSKKSELQQMHMKFPEHISWESEISLKICKVLLWFFIRIMEVLLIETCLWL